MVGWTKRQSLLPAVSMYARMLCEDAGRPVMGPTASLGDNSACHELVQKEGQSSRTRHFERAVAAVKFAVLTIVIKPFLVASELMIADGFTKALEPEGFHRCKNALRNVGKESYMSLKVGRLASALSKALGG